MDLRKRANEEGDAMAKCFQESHEAYENHDGAKAKELSNRGKEHQANMERLNKEASDWIFIGASILSFMPYSCANLRQRTIGYVFAPNPSDLRLSSRLQDSGPNEVDLHGLYVKEAIYHTDKAIEEAKQRGDTEIHLIVG
jgi:hypothetical protein